MATTTDPVANSHSIDTKSANEDPTNGIPNAPSDRPTHNQKDAGQGQSGQNNAQKKPRPKKKGPNYAQIHSKPLPLEVHPLPAFHPSHPLSLLHFCYVALAQLLFPPSSHPKTPYLGYLSLETRSVHVTDPQTVRALWEMGFFGKGTLSRSEPSWLEREKARVMAEREKARGKGTRGGGGTAEEATRKRREERRLFKLERARAERERIERQRDFEEGRMSKEEYERLQAADEGKAEEDGAGAGIEADANAVAGAESTEQTTAPAPRVPDVEIIEPQAAQPDESPLPDLAVTAPCGTSIPPAVPEIEEPEPEPEIRNQEHLQLTFEEAFFLSFALGVLSIRVPSIPEIPAAASNQDLLNLFAAHSSFPPQLSPAETYVPDSAFVLNYVTYHHFRSLGWVVRPGVKFAVDYLLYNRGPVFSHAEFAVLIFPAYTHPYWKSEAGMERRRIKGGLGGEGMRDWWWLHCVNRVQSQVRKTLVFCYVDVPPPVDLDGEGKDVSVREWVGRYKIREFTVRRWLANRSRD